MLAKKILMKKKLGSNGILSEQNRTDYHSKLRVTGMKQWGQGKHWGVEQRSTLPRSATVPAGVGRGCQSEESA